jgi:hypothetical protein
MVGTTMPPTQATPEDHALARKCLLISIVLVGVYLIVGFRWFFTLLFGGSLDAWQLAFWWPIYRFSIAFCLFLVVPWATWCKKWRKTVQELGWQWGNVRWGVILTLVGAAFVVAIGFTTAGDATMTAVYPLGRVFADPSYGPFNLVGYIVMEALYVFLYYIPYEFFFRGFCQFPLLNQGKVRAIWVVLYTTAITTAVHWDVPTTELVAAFAVGFVYGIVAIKCRSIRYGLINHAAVGLATDFSALLSLQGII